MIDLHVHTSTNNQNTSEATTLSIENMYSKYLKFEHFSLLFTLLVIMIMILIALYIYIYIYIYISSIYLSIYKPNLTITNQTWFEWHNNHYVLFTTIKHKPRFKDQLIEQSWNPS